ncbi:MAG: hypothetical protein IKS37_10255 [Solobacterium sp.]|nr:hypothetical protein [Solobacterium sp.]
MNISPIIYEQCRKTLVQPEMGGILGCDADGNIVAYHFDATAETDHHNAYTPDIRQLNEVIRQWYAQDIYFAGFIHTHGFRPRLTCGDIAYAETIKKSCEMEDCLMMIYVLATDKFYEYVV